MKLTEEKLLLEVLLAVVSSRGETQCVGNVHNVSSTRVAKFDLLLLMIIWGFFQQGH